MPEGDSIHFAANRLRPALVGGPLDAVSTPSARTAGRGWPERLAGATVTAVQARGKHLLILFDGGLVLHSHLRMHGSWAVRPNEDAATASAAVRTATDGASARPETTRAGSAAAVPSGVTVVSGDTAEVRAHGRLGRPLRRAWIVMSRDGHEVIQFDGPFLELRSAAQVAADPRLAGLGPDICAEAPLDVDRVIRRLRQDDPHRPAGDALLDQRTVAGFGNVWKSEACHLVGLDPWRPLAQTTDDELRHLLVTVEPLMKRCAVDGTGHRPKAVYGRRDRRCERCGDTIVSRKMGDDNRNTWWCPGCQT
ncbi:MAG: DNA-formamidopyrimidine glycosylase family protein [Solirubrobacteraceae bacterium]